MMRSLLSGAFWGLLSGSFALVAISLSGPQPAGNKPPVPPLTEAPEAVADDPQSVETPEEIAEVVEELATPAEPTVPTGLAPVAEGALPDTDTDPLEVPAAVPVETALVAPESAELPDLGTTGEDPVLPNPQSVAPQVPANEEDLVIETQTALLPVADDAPVVVEDVAEPLVEPEPIDEGETATVDESIPEIPDTAPVVEAETAEPIQPEVIETAELIEPETSDPITPPAEEAPAPATETPPALSAPSDGGTEPVVVTDPEMQQAPGEDDAPVVVSIIENNRASSMPESTEGVVINRGGSSADNDVAEEAEPVAEIDPDAPAIKRYAAEFENPENKPVMSVVLVDDGSLQEAAAALAQVPFPVTVVLDPTADGATAAMEAYRAAGIEVAVKAKLPVGAQPADVEVALEAAFAALPETVMMVETGDGNLLEDRDVFAQAVAALASDGRGLLTVSQGLNTGLRTAEASGVPSGLIYRDLDAEDQNARVIRRFLDQAAFRARREDGVVLMARVRAETLTALIEWANANRSDQIMMAPVSAVLTAD
ncbi:divergent polysaccharide deacetylase family protein [Cognatiyoonia koreensis]|nr:divergent polysaccharide deacetylase family protein [Cognatiyoonia koreensis]